MKEVFVGKHNDWYQPIVNEAVRITNKVNNRSEVFVAFYMDESKISGDNVCKGCVFYEDPSAVITCAGQVGLHCINIIYKRVAAVMEEL